MIQMGKMKGQLQTIEGFSVYIVRKQVNNEYKLNNKDE